MRVRLIGTVMVAAMLVLAACGGDNSNSSGATTTSGSSSGSATTTSGSGGSTGGTDLASAFGGNCAAEAQFIGAGIAAAFTGQSGNDIDQLLNQFDSFASNAPSAIKADAKTMADVFKKFLQAVKDAGIDLSDPSTFSNIQQLTKLGQIAQASGLESPEYQAASDRVSAYFDANCKSG